MADLEEDGMLQLLLDERLAGRSWFDIQNKHGIPMEEAKRLYNEALMQNATKDPVEMRYLQQLQIERVIASMWKFMEAGSFKHAETIVKALERLSDLMDLNQSTLKRQLTIISDEETLQILEVMKRFGRALENKVLALPELTDEIKLELKAWPEWVAEAATDSVEEVVYAEVED